MLCVDMTPCAEKQTRMHEIPTNPIAPLVPVESTAGLFTWRGGGIVLIGTQEDGHWVLARGWLQGDRLQHIRRWTFAQPIPFSRQVRRLVSDAHGGTTDAREAGLHALEWAEAASV